MTFRRYLRGAENVYLRDTGIANQPPFRTISPTEALMDAPAKDKRAFGYGIFCIVCGTLIWGYGDMLLRAIGACTH